MSRPLRELEHGGLLQRKRENRRDWFALTDLGASVRAVLLGGPPLLTGSWVLTVRHGAAEPKAVRELLAAYPDISVQSCAGDSDFLVLHQHNAADADSADLADALRKLAADASRQCVVRHVL